MKKILKYFAFIFMTLSCSKSDDTVSTFSKSHDTVSTFNYLNTYKKIVNWVTYKRDTTDTCYLVEYYLDDIGRVYKSNFKHYSGVPGWNYEKAFIYDEKNRIVAEYCNGTLSLKYFWNQNTVDLYNNKNEFQTKFVYDGDRLVNCGQSDYKYYNNSYNVSSVWQSNNLQSEYFEYDDNVINPLFYLKSIELSFLMETNRIMSFGPVSKNINNKQKDQPIDGGDYSIPLKTYNYIYVLDKENRVIYSENDKAYTYSWFYKYIP